MHLLNIFKYPSDSFFFIRSGKITILCYKTGVKFNAALKKSCRPAHRHLRVHHCLQNESRVKVSNKTLPKRPWNVFLNIFVRLSVVQRTFINCIPMFAKQWNVPFNVNQSVQLHGNVSKLFLEGDVCVSRVSDRSGLG